MASRWKTGLLVTSVAAVLASCQPISPPTSMRHPVVTPTAQKPQQSDQPVLPYRRPRGPWHNPVLLGDVLIADSRNNRILLVSPDKSIVWQFPPPGQPSPLRDDDDAFFSPDFSEIITNEESNHTIAIIDISTGKVVWTYGHPRSPGAAPGYLNTPDDAFLYARDGGLITVADIRNQRILFISRTSGQIVKQYGRTGVWSLHPPATWGSPNGDFPAPDGGMLVTQIGGDDAVLLDRNNRIVWTLRFPAPLHYPSDANLTPDGNVICAFYTAPGAVVKMSPDGRVLWRYDVKSGSGMLRFPSLAVELPNGNVLLNDDLNHRVVVIDPRTNEIVWQYGHTGIPGSSPGYLDVPDGVDWLPAGVVPGAANPIGGHLWSYPGNGY
ncbi:MAG TPA: PQQ-binding-like beta-propeller repeat protein [Ktedonobacterales bacterium]|jgi:DNA-binding beta-propeller fold protein YncE|nr:PQQ-binding-like beta-propeller repeat protein [Ktedonobacterales bacterium]